MTGLHDTRGDPRGVPRWTAETPPRLAFLVHSPVDLPALLEEEARAQGLAVSVHHLYRGPGELPEPSSFDGLVLLGAARSVNGEGPGWLEAERRLLARAVEEERPVLGVCFGGQLLAQVLGGRVRPGERPEIGWVSLVSEEPELVGPGPWLAWHGEVFEPPPGSRLLAWTELAPQAFTVGPHLGVQFHPEMTPELLAVWVRRSVERGRLSADRGEELLAGAAAHAGGARQRAHELLDRHLRRAGLGAVGPGDD